MDISEDKPEAFSKALLKVEDIDENDKDNPQLVSEYVNDIYQYMKELEVGFISFLCLQFLKLLKIWTTVKEKLFGSSRFKLNYFLESTHRMVTIIEVNL